jgi:hypothetical protein
LKVVFPTFNFQPPNFQPFYDEQELNPDDLASETVAKTGAGAASVQYLTVSLDVPGLH